MIPTYFPHQVEPSGSVLSSSGSATVSWTGKSLKDSALSANGVAAVSWVGKSLNNSVLNSNGVATVAWTGATGGAAGELNSNGVAAVSWVGKSLVNSIFSSSGIASVLWQSPAPVGGFVRGIRFGGSMLTKEIQGGNKAARDIKFASHLNAALNAAATVTLTAEPGKRHLVHELHWSYSPAPTGGKITITGGPVNFEVDITAGAPDSLHLSYVGSLNTNTVITVAAGGASVQGKLNVGYTVEVG